MAQLIELLLRLWVFILDTVKRLLRRKPSGAWQQAQHHHTQGADGERTSIHRLLGPAGVKPGRRKTLVLDLDETLVHSSSVALGPHHDLCFEIYIDRRVTQFYVYKRPFVDVFLREASVWYDVVVFTASVKEYAGPVIDALDSPGPQGRLIQRRYYRESCNGPNFAKDLSIVDTNLGGVIIVDNSPMAYSTFPDNAIPIETWICNKDDTQLRDLLPFLRALHSVDDVRSILKFRNINQVRR
eukprot:comp22612_c0_seq1/m.34716 comp22612_c0_seq1/g.34716  ORF comp22612_c0_seq1/g.34716 comp22612_c0_seq1/m.34716 type:complete len:241 (-) comp22612_c0_seq1:191-913(-)